MKRLTMEKDKKIRNKVEAIVFSCYGIGVILTVLTHTPIFILTTLLSVPISMKCIK